MHSDCAILESSYHTVKYCSYHSILLLPLMHSFIEMEIKIIAMFSDSLIGFNTVVQLSIVREITKLACIYLEWVACYQNILHNEEGMAY